TLSRSSDEAEYRCVECSTYEVVWLVNQLKDLNMEGLHLVSLYCDSSFANQIDANPIFHEKIKYSRIDVHSVREKFALGVIRTVKASSTNQITDIFTKGLSVP
nr:ribonuclease H-like domain-containing protein [Tanacetum cinerariifolium]